VYNAAYVDGARVADACSGREIAGRFRYSHYEAYDRDVVVRLLRSVFCGSSKNTRAHEIGYPIRGGVR
jgi:hypothetical protein